MHKEIQSRLEMLSKKKFHYFLILRQRHSYDRNRGYAGYDMPYAPVPTLHMKWYEKNNPPW